MSFLGRSFKEKREGLDLMDAIGAAAMLLLLLLDVGDVDLDVVAPLSVELVDDGGRCACRRSCRILDDMSDGVLLLIRVLTPMDISPEGVR